MGLSFFSANNKYQCQILTSADFCKRVIKKIVIMENGWIGLDIELKHYATQIYIIATQNKTVTGFAVKK